jgi:hypothetical protein
LEERGQALRAILAFGAHGLDERRRGSLDIARCPDGDGLASLG